MVRRILSALSYRKDIYNEKKAQAASAKSVSTKTTPAEAPVQKGKNSYEFGKERSRLERKVQKLEAQVNAMETLIEEKKAELLLPEYASSYSKLEAISAEIEEKEMELLELMEEWDEAEQKLAEMVN